MEFIEMLMEAKKLLKEYDDTVAEAISLAGSKELGLGDVAADLQKMLSEEDEKAQVQIVGKLFATAKSIRKDDPKQAQELIDEARKILRKPPTEAEKKESLIDAINREFPMDKREEEEARKREEEEKKKEAEKAEEESPERKAEKEDAEKSRETAEKVGKLLAEAQENFKEGNFDKAVELCREGNSRLSFVEETEPVNDLKKSLVSSINAITLAKTRRYLEDSKRFMQNGKFANAITRAEDGLRTIGEVPALNDEGQTLKMELQDQLNDAEYAQIKDWITHIPSIPKRKDRKSKIDDMAAWVKRSMMDTRRKTELNNSLNSLDDAIKAEIAAEEEAKKAEEKEAGELQDAEQPEGLSPEEARKEDKGEEEKKEDEAKAGEEEPEVKEEEAEEKEEEEKEERKLDLSLKKWSANNVLFSEKRTSELDDLLSDDSSAAENRLKAELEHAREYFTFAIRNKKKLHGRKKAKKDILRRIEQRLEEIRDPNKGIVLPAARSKADTKLRELKDFVDNIDPEATS